MDHNRSSEQDDVVDLPVSRRTLAAGAVWSLPVIATIGAAPAMAASSFGPSYAGSASGASTSTSGVWSNVSNAQGSTQGNYAIWTYTNIGNAAGTLTLTQFPNSNKTLAQGEQVVIQVKHYESVTTDIDTLVLRFENNNGGNTLQQWNVTPSSSTANISSFTYTAPAGGVSLSSLRVLLVATLKSGNHRTGTFNVDWVSIQHTHIP